MEAVSNNVEIELKKIGLRLINVNVTDINDESGYIEALGKEAAAKAINDAKKVVAERDRDGEIGKANAERDQRRQVSLADAMAIKGENDAKVEVADSNAQRRMKEAEALRIATAAEKVQAAKALEEAYTAEKEAELTRAELERAKQQADIIIKAEIEKERKEIEAKTDAEVERVRARGEADAIFLKLEAQAKGMEEILTRQAAGMKKMVEAAGGNADTAVKLLIADKLEELTRIQVDAIKNIKIDKVTVWDSNNGDSGKTSTANFLSGLLGAIPPMNELFDQAGMKLPSFFGEESEKNPNPKENIEAAPTENTGE